MHNYTQKNIEHALPQNTAARQEVLGKVTHTMIKETSIEGFVEMGISNQQFEAFLSKKNPKLKQAGLDANDLRALERLPRLSSDARLIKGKYSVSDWLKEIESLPIAEKHLKKVVEGFKIHDGQIIVQCCKEDATLHNIINKNSIEQ